MTRKECVCGRMGFEKCPVHGDPVRGPAVTDEEFMELVVRNRGAIQEVFVGGEVVPIRKLGRPRSKGGVL